MAITICPATIGIYCLGWNVVYFVVGELMDLHFKSHTCNTGLVLSGIHKPPSPLAFITCLIF